MHMNNLDEYRSFLKTIKEPLIRLDHVEVKKLEAIAELEMLELNFQDSKDEDKFTETSQDILKLISWCEEEIDSLRDNYPIKIEQRKEASWVGQHRGFSRLREYSPKTVYRDHSRQHLRYSL